MIVKVKLVTHSIIPNLNSGLVPIDPVGLVFSFVAWLLDCSPVSGVTQCLGSVPARTTLEADSAETLSVSFNFHFSSHLLSKSITN